MNKKEFIEEIEKRLVRHIESTTGAVAIGYAEAVTRHETFVQCYESVILLAECLEEKGE